MARHLRTILGDMLVTQALDSQNPEELPSPEVMSQSPSLGGEGSVCGPRSTRSCQLPGSRPSPLSAFTFPAPPFLRHLPLQGLSSFPPSNVD